MKRKLKPNERVALLASLVAVTGGLTPVLSRGWSNTGDFVSGLLLGLIGVLLVAGVALWLKARPAD